MYSIYLTHRNPAYWPEPHKFDPARFESGSPTPYTFLPFGGGSRNCIGAAFARLEAQFVLARLLQQFEFEFVGKRVRPYMRATLEPHPGVPVRITRA
jgi:cytochrome P450 family 26 subfamily A